MAPSSPTSAAHASKRRYELRSRAEHASRTRAAIIAAAHGLLDDRNAPRLTLDEVARAAGVSRATVYNQFGSRRALLAAVFQDVGRIVGYERVLASQSLEDPRQALEATVREACRCWSSSRVAIRRILALGVLDPEVDEVNERYEAYRRADMATLAARLEQAGALGAGVTREQAAALIGSLTSPHAFDLFTRDAPPELAAERLVHVATATLGLRPPSKE